MTKIRLVDPVKSLIASMHARRRGPNPKFKRNSKGEVGNPHGIGLPLPGDKGKNPTGKGGFGDNPSQKQLAARLRSGFGRGNNANPYGRLGFKAAGIQKMPKKTRRTPESEGIVREAREITNLARKHAPAAIDALGKIIKKKHASEMAQIAAANSLLDRGYGKPTQNINQTVNTDGSAKEIDPRELDKRIASVIERIEGTRSRARKKIKGKK